MQERRADEMESTIAAAMAGDRDALQQAWEANRAWVAAIISAHKPRWASLEDLVQDVAVSVVRNVGTLRDPAAFRPWLRTVAINAARLAARSPSRVEPLSDDRIVEPASVDRSGDLAAAGRSVLDLASELPEGYREPLFLKAVKGMTYREIGRLLGLPETTVETRISRGRRMLRELAEGRPLAADLV